MPAPGRRSLAARWPLPLAIAAGVVTLEAFGLLGLGIWLGYESIVATADNPAVARGSTAYFLLLGALTTLVAVALFRLQGWGAGAGVCLQLLALPMAWYMLTEGFLVGAAPLGVLATIALVGLLAPSTRHALGR